MRCMHGGKNNNCSNVAIYSDSIWIVTGISIENSCHKIFFMPNIIWDGYTYLDRIKAKNPNLFRRYAGVFV